MGELSLQESQQVHMVKMSSKPWKGKEVSDYYKIHPKSLPSYRPVLQRKKKKQKTTRTLSQLEEGHSSQSNHLKFLCLTLEEEIWSEGFRDIDWNPVTMKRSRAQGDRNLYY